MKKSFIAGIFIAVLCLGLIDVLRAGEPSSQLKATPQKWEYQILTIDHLVKPQDQLNELGKDGWELMSVQEQVSNGNTLTVGGVVSFYFKRPLSQ